LVARGLLVEGLPGDEVTIAQAVRSAHPKLSLPDAFAYALASVRGWTLLTGDCELSAAAGNADASPLAALRLRVRQFRSRQRQHAD
jgi:hypothetical protein